jgi:hypothetical protein
LSRDAGVAALTAHGARVAGGRIDRASVLAQFAPRQSAAAWSSRAEHISLLITTDLLSEGLNLQEASVIVHLDLPWNPARLEQRVGRARRLGSRHEVVTVYTLAPPASAVRLLRIEARLETKLQIARKAIGASAPLLPMSTTGCDAREITGSADALGATEAALRRWMRREADVRDEDPPAPREPATFIARDDEGLVAAGEQTTFVAAVRADVDGCLAVIANDGRTRIVADVGGGLVTDPRAVYYAVLASEGVEIVPAEEHVCATMARLERWLETERALSAIDGRPAAASNLRRSALARVARVVATAPHHRRASVARSAMHARAALAAHLSAGAERAMDIVIASGAEASIDTPAVAEEWLEALSSFADEDRSAARGLPRLGERIIAMVLLEKPHRR